MTNLKSSQRRVIPRDKSETVSFILHGTKQPFWSDLYVRLLDAAWHHLFVVIVLVYFVINFLFASLYLAGAQGIENARAGSFIDLFFFSVQTFATIGYGKMAPVGFVANLLVTIEAFTGFAFYAVVTGLVFSKFSRPTSRVLFSKVAVICDFNGKPHLMLRLANKRGNRIVDAKISLVLLRREISLEGHQMRRFHDLKLTRESIPLLQLSWTAMHPITEDSPLYQATADSLKQSEVEIIVSINGLDETLSQTIHARYSYIYDEIICGARFKDIMSRNEKSQMQIDYTKFHDVEPANSSLT